LCGERGLIESVSSVDEGLRSLSVQIIREPFTKAQFLDALACLSISLGDRFCNVTLEEPRCDFIELTDCILCPTNRIARWSE